MGTFAQTDSGLVYPVEGMDGSAVRAALKAHDRNLDLAQQIDPDYGCWVYKVTYVTGPDRAETLFAWRGPSGEPLPLSSALVDKAKALDKNTSFRQAAPEELNAAHSRAREQDWERAHEDLRDEHLYRTKRSSTLPRGQSLYLARAKRRAKGLEK